MLLRQFRETGLGTILLIIVTLLLVWASAFIKLQGHFSLYFDLEPMPLYGILSSIIGTHPLPGIIFTLLLVALMAFLMVDLNTSLFFINQRTFLPAVIYILLSGFFPQYQLLNPAIFAAMLLMLAIRRIMDAYRISGIAYNFFDAGLFIGIGSLFYANLIWFGLLVFIGIALLRTGNIREIVIAVIGLITPFIMTLGIFYLSGTDLKSFFSIQKYNLFNKPDSYVFNSFSIVALVFAGLITVLSIAYLLRYMSTKKIKSSKTFYLFIWLFLISLVVYIVIPSVSVEIIWIIAIPVSYFLAHYFVSRKKSLLHEIFFSLLFVIILVIQLLYLI